MNPAIFPESNMRHCSPKGMDEAHVKTIPSCRATVNGGVWDGSDVVVVAWQPTEAELKELNAGGRVYLTMMGGLPAHFVSTSFKEATTL